MSVVVCGVVCVVCVGVVCVVCVGCVAVASMGVVPNPSPCDSCVCDSTDVIAFSVCGCPCICVCVFGECCARLVFEMRRCRLSLSPFSDSRSLSLSREGEPEGWRV